MGYQALLFCPDEKTARTVTQVLSELEFSVESCSEPFASVKKLMAGHFDAVVVDCDNEQNATLLFKSARNSSSNQTSLAVAVVEGQTGVAKAFRIGANLVLTKPINVEQAKGTLRVARGLLRKGDPAKLAASVPTAPAAGKSSSAPANAASKPAAPLAPPAVQRAAATATVPKPTIAATSPVQAASAKASRPPVAQTPAAFEPDVLDVDTEAPVAPAPKSAPTQPFSKTSAPAGGFIPSGAAHSGGAASAPAPARAAQEPGFGQPTSESIGSTPDLDSANRVSDYSAPAPSFTFGGANAPEPTGGSKRAIIGVAAAALIGAGLYFGWTQFHGKSSQSSPVAQQPAPTGGLTPQTTQPSKPKPSLPSSELSSVNPAPSPGSLPTASQNPSSEKPDASGPDVSGEDAPESLTSAPKSSANKNSAKKAKPEPATSAKPAAEDKPAPQPIMVKRGTAAAGQGKTVPAADATAPSVLGLAPAASGDGLPNLIPDSDAPQPVLQTLNVSQGVSQGLLIKKVQPTYPATALRMHVEGSVQLAATIAKTGSITSVKVLSGEPLLAQAALDAVKQWKYKPYFLNGDPVEIQTQITVNFKLPR